MSGRNTGFYHYRGYEFRIDVNSIKKRLSKRKSPYKNRRLEEGHEDISNNSSKSTPVKKNELVPASRPRTESFYRYQMETDYKKKYVGQQQNILDLERENNDLKKEISSKERKLRDCMDKIRMMRDAFQSNYDIYQHRMSEFEIERETYRKENSELKSKMKRLNVTNIVEKKREETISRFKSKNIDLHEKIEKLNEENGIIRKKLEYYKRSVDHLEAKLENEEDREENVFKNKLDEMFAQKTLEVEDERKEMADYTINLQNKLKEKQEEVKLQKKTIKNLREICETLRKRISSKMRSGKGGPRRGNNAIRGSRDNSKFRVAVSDLM